jgi:UPF0755 protein
VTLLEERPHPAPKRLPKPVGVLVVFLVFVALVAGIALGGRALVRSFTGAPDFEGQGAGKVVVQVKPGDSAQLIGTTLQSMGVVKSVKAFTKAAQDDERSRGVQPGFYALRLKMSAAAALQLLLDPKARVRGRVTLPEGITVAKVVARLEQFTDLKRADIVAALDNPAALGLPSYARNRVEGFLFPATYDIEPDMGAVEALTMMTQQFTTQAASVDLESRAAALDLTPYEAVIVASIVEAESPLAADRVKVARVIYNRLAKGMPLQMDSTINYFREEKKARLTLKDIAEESPYNTYRNRGLTPTPINSPGAGSLEAALAPAKGDWLYFVAIDKSGGSFFTSDYQEFLRAKAKAQREGVY